MELNRLRKSDLEGLRELLKITDKFSDDIFDWVAALYKPEFLRQVYDFENQIDSAIKYLEKQ